MSNCVNWWHRFVLVAQLFEKQIILLKLKGKKFAFAFIIRSVGGNFNKSLTTHVFNHLIAGFSEIDFDFKKVEIDEDVEKVGNEHSLRQNFFLEMPKYRIDEYRRMKTKEP